MKRMFGHEEILKGLLSDAQCKVKRKNTCIPDRILTMFCI